jgi:hypothetical protein
MADDDLPMPTEEDENKLYTAIGRAITGWAALEEVLFAITHSVLDCTEERASIVFYRTPTIDSRLTLTSDLVHSFFPRHESGEHPDPRVKRWKEIQAEIKDCMPVRNRLAHHPVGPVVEVYESADGEHKIGVRHASYISQAEYLRRREAPSPPTLTAEEIDIHAQLVSHLVHDLRNFHRQKFRKPPPVPGT